MVISASRKAKNSLNQFSMEDVCVERASVHNLRSNHRSDLKVSHTLKICLGHMKNWTTDKCNCRLCKVFIANLGCT